MKRISGLLAAACLLAAPAFAQSTMPAIGANTSKGEVAKTDASVNARRATDTTSRKGSMRSGKMQKTKTKGAKSTM